MGKWIRYCLFIIDSFDFDFYNFFQKIHQNVRNCFIFGFFALFDLYLFFLVQLFGRDLDKRRNRSCQFVWEFIFSVFWYSVNAFDNENEIKHQFGLFCWTGGFWDKRNFDEICLQKTLFETSRDFFLCNFDMPLYRIHSMEYGVYDYQKKRLLQTKLCHKWLL